MSWFRRLGLQRRIMLYVGIGLALMLFIGAYLGSRAIQQATELVYRERLGTAFTTAVALERNIQWLAHEVESMRSRLSKAESRQELEEIGRDLLTGVSATSPFPFVRGQSLWLIDLKTGSLVSLPISAEAIDGTLPIGSPITVQEPTLLAPLAPSEDPLFGTLAVPIIDDSGFLRWMVFLHLAALNQDQPYFLSPPRTSQGTAAPADPLNVYGLEVMNPEGKVALTRGGVTQPGKISPHWQIFQKQSAQTRGSFVFVHEPNKDQHFPPHVISVVPLTIGSFVVVLEQREDVALALPLSWRQRLIMFSVVGFLITMLVAWITTRHVVKPTEQLTMAAQRIAEGKTEKPITVVAQDEIGTLADSLEIMRRRLQTWGSELEKQVQERTSQLEERNRELRVLYETLRKKEEQLRILLSKVLYAQEDERKRLSRELHDGIGQALSAITMGLEILEQPRSERSLHLEGHIERLRELAKDTLSDLRRLTVALRPAALDDLGLVPAIRRYAEIYLGNAGVECDVREEDLKSRLDPSLETVVYRIVQEAINNIARHSAATRASVLLQSTGNALVVTVEDNGRGFEPKSGVFGQGVGIQGMQERASMAGGKLTVESQPGHGTTVRLEIPLEERVGQSEDV